MAWGAQVTKPYQDRDVTLVPRHSGTGIGFTRICFDCNKKRIERGGKTDKRTRMWQCAVCVESKEAIK